MTSVDHDLTVLEDMEFAIPCQDTVHGTSMQPIDDPAEHVLTFRDYPHRCPIEDRGVVTKFECGRCIQTRQSLNWRYWCQVCLTDGLHLVVLRLEPINTKGNT